MNGDALIFAQVMVVIVGSVASFVGIGLGARILWRLGSRVPSRPVPPAREADRLRRLETAVDAIAFEVERISEAQRFTVTLLSDRLPGDRLPGALGDRVGERPTPRAPHRTDMAS